MSENNKMQLNLSSILNVPLQMYDDDFCFIVNGKKFTTSKLISDLLSPNISKIHSSDPTFDTFIINTQHEGDFTNILNLINFEPNDLPESELPFIIEAIKILNNGFIEITEPSQSAELNVNNIFKLIEKHDKTPDYYSKRLKKEIEFISIHFFELTEEHEDEFSKISPVTLFEIIQSPKLQMKSEDQLLRIANSLYKKDPNYSILYETVYFANVTEKTMNEFIEIFDFNNMTKGTWSVLCQRLGKGVKEGENDREDKRYHSNKTVKKIGKKFSIQNCENNFSGILNFLRKKSLNEIDITCSSCFGFSDDYQPKNVIIYEDKKKSFWSNLKSNSWLCFDFKQNRVIPSDYTIRSCSCSVNWAHPKSWVIEGSNDNGSWSIIDQVENCGFLNGPGLVHSFKIQSQNRRSFRYIRMRAIGPDWQETSSLMIESFEIYGTLIEN